MRFLMSVLVVIVVSSCSGAGITEPPKEGCLAVRGTFNPSAPGFIVEYKSGVDPVATTAELSAKYSFTPTHVYTVIPGFAAQLSAQAVRGVSCESAVSAIDHDGIAYFAGI